MRTVNDLSMLLLSHTHIYIYIYIPSGKRLCFQTASQGRHNRGFTTKGLHRASFQTIQHQPKNRRIKKIKDSNIEEEEEGVSYLLWAVSVDHGRGWRRLEEWALGAKQLAGLQWGGVVCHGSLIHTTDQALPAPADKQANKHTHTHTQIYESQ